MIKLLGGGTFLLIVFIIVAAILSLSSPIHYARVWTMDNDILTDVVTGRTADRITTTVCNVDGLCVWDETRNTDMHCSLFPNLPPGNYKVTIEVYIGDRYESRESQVNIK